MLMLIQPSEQLITALLVGGATVSAAVVNATAQVKVAREARKNSKPVPPASKRVMRWLVVSAAVALGLGWNAVSADDGARAPAPGFLGAGVTSVLGNTLTADDAGSDLIVASLRLARPLAEADVMALLHAYGLRAYAVDMHLGGDGDAWLALPPGTEPALSLPRARAAAVRRAWLETCALEAQLVGGDAARDGDASVVARDSAITPETATDPVPASPQQEAAAQARARAERLGEVRAVIHALRVLATPEAATAAAQDPAVAGAEIVRFDPGWPMEEAPPVVEGCDVVPIAAS
ncbi:MAG TPA: hypothetical protein VF039_03825 [Longimicrobiales bacterium]